MTQRKRKRVEETFGWGKTVGNHRQVHFYGLTLVAELTRWTGAAFKLVRLRKVMTIA